MVTGKHSSQAAVEDAPATKSSVSLAANIAKAAPPLRCAVHGMYRYAATGLTMPPRHPVDSTPIASRRSPTAVTYRGRPQSWPIVKLSFTPCLQSLPSRPVFVALLVYLRLVALDPHNSPSTVPKALLATYVPTSAKN